MNERDIERLIKIGTIKALQKANLITEREAERIITAVRERGLPYETSGSVLPNFYG